MTITVSDLFLGLPEFHPIDMFRKVGGFHTNQHVTDTVDSLFQPGIILGSDASESYTYQYRKAFLKNVSGQALTSVRVYGYNIKNSNFVKFALEKGHDQIPLIDGSEAIKDYLTSPSLYGEYVYTELHSNNSLLIGSDGILSDMRGQGVWFRQRIPKNSSDIASDQFSFSAKYVE